MSSWMLGHPDGAAGQRRVDPVGDGARGDVVSAQQALRVPAAADGGGRGPEPGAGEQPQTEISRQPCNQYEEPAE